MPHFEFEIIADDNLKLYGQGWESDAEIKAVVCLLHCLETLIAKADSWPET